jgi:hypothetical protein
MVTQAMALFGLCTALATAGCKMNGGLGIGGGSTGPATTTPSTTSESAESGDGIASGMGGKNLKTSELWPGAAGKCNDELASPFSDTRKLGDPNKSPARELISYVGDVDGDRDIDVITYLDSGESGGDIAGWHENRGGGKFTYNPISQGGTTNTDIWVADMDGDGDLDLLHASDDFGTDQAGGLAIYENVGNARSWKRHWLIKGEDVGRVWAGDIDGDGANDIVIERDAKLHWLANENKNGSKWSKPRALGDVFSDVRLVAAHDLDRDGDDDFVYAVVDQEVGWLQNTGKGRSWQRILLGTDLSHRYATMAQSVVVTDFDGDGDADVIAGNGSYVGGVHVFTNADGKGTFARTKLLERDNYNQAGAVAVADVTGDKRIDVIVGSEHSDGVLTFSYNPETRSCGKATSARNKIERIIDLRTGDLDGDGDIDAVVSRAGYGLVWFENSTK